MQLVRSKSGVGDTNVETLYYLAIASARKIARPDLGLLRAAAGLHRRSVRRGRARSRRAHPRPGPHIDKGFVRVAGRDSYGALLDAGVRLFEYQPTMLHAKSLVVDGCWSSVGTVNFDNRSFQLHDEIMLGVWDSHFAGLLTEQFEKDVETLGRDHAGALGRAAARECERPRPPCACFAASSRGESRLAVSSPARAAPLQKDRA